MKNIIVQYGQTWVDIAAQYCGDASRALEISLLNGYDDVTGDISAGDVLKVPTDLTAATKKLAAVFTSKNAPASAIEVDEFADEWEQYYNEGLPLSHE